MAELALDSSLPSGALDIAANGPIFDTATGLGLDNVCSKPLTPSAAHATAMQSPPVKLNFPNAVSHFTTGYPTSQSSARRDGGRDGGDGGVRHIPGGFFHANLSSLSPPATWDFGPASLARSVSADTVMPSYTSSHFHSGLGGRTSLVERSNLDALRHRAERLYRDQQAVIDEMSDEWLKEKAEMSQLIHLLRERLQRLEAENAVLKSMASRNPRGPDLVSPQNNVQSGTLGGLYSSKAPSPQGPLGPRTEPRNSASTDFLLASLSSESAGEAPIIDIQEIDPKLEGIPLKATAVQRSTFEPPSTAKAVAKNPSIETTQLVHAENDFHQTKRKGLWGAWEREKLRNDRRRSGLAPLTTAKNQEQADHILAADESRRLTMHAGHTPNHSLSLFSTMTAAESSSAAARSQGTTPTAEPSSNRGGRPMDASGDDGGGDKVGVAQQSDDPEDNGPGRQMDGVVDAEMEGLLEPADDVPLKGPLMIKNIPAQDEIFWAQVNQRLDPISRGKDALPKVLQVPEPDTIQQPLEDATSPRQEDAKVPEELSAALESDEEGEDDNAGVEADVPLIFRATSNFGAPFGLVLS
ncbi:hypothetical protein E4U53_002840 [Claviceps sorghi]|nr:hypothetical protein E4U53_002840 [Claviceps sorghi]